MDPPRVTVPGVYDAFRQQGEQLDEAQRHWPDVRDRKELLLRLAAAGRAAIAREANERGSAIEQTGALTGVYRADELEQLHEDWPA